MQVPASESGVGTARCWGDVRELPFSALAVPGGQPPWEMHASALAAAQVLFVTNNLTRCFQEKYFQLIIPGFPLPL